MTYQTLRILKTYRDEIYSLQILLSRTQAGPGRAVKQEQEEISPNHVQRLNLISVQKVALGCFQGLNESFLSSCVGRQALLQLHCSLARWKLQEELLGMNEQKL